MSDPSRDALLASLARRQHGVFTRQQALAVGFPASTIDAWVESGRWLRSGRGVLAVAAAPVTYRRAAMAAVLSIDGAVASHETAATLHGFRHLDVHPIVITAPAGSWQRLDGVIVHRYLDLRPDHVTALHEIAVTRPERTVIDLAAVVHPARLELVLDAALADGRIRLDLLIRTFNQVARRGRRGVGRIRPLVAARGEGYVAPDSELERRYVGFGNRYGLPVASRQVPLFWQDQLIGLVDFVYDDERLIVEVDGRLGHGQLRDFELDRARDQRAAAAGWTVVRVTWRQLHREPGRVASSIRDALAVRRGDRARTLKAQPHIPA